MFQYINQYKDGLSSPCGIYVDTYNNMYIITSHRLIKVNSNYEVIGQFGSTLSTTDNTGFSVPKSVCLDSHGNIYVADSGNHRVVKLNSNMEYVGQFGTTGTGGTGSINRTNSPRDVFTDKDDNIYIVSYFGGEIIRLNNNMEYISSVGSLQNPTGGDIDKNGNLYVNEYNGSRITKIDISSQRTYYNLPDRCSGDVGVGDDGYIYVADDGRHRLIKLNSNLEYISQFGITGTYKIDNTGLKSPQRVFIYNNNIYIADTGNNRIMIIKHIAQYEKQFGTTGTSKSDNTGLYSPNGVFVDSSGNIYIADGNNHRVIKLDSNMQYISQFGTTGVSKTDNTGLNSPYGVSVDIDGNIYVADYNNHRVIKLNSNMEYITQFGITGTYKSDNTGLKNPTDVSVNNNGNVYVSDRYNNRLVKLNSNMEYISQFGTTGTYKKDNTGLYYPYGVSVDTNDNIYVADTYNYRLVKLDSNMEYVSQFGTTGSSKTDNTGFVRAYGVSVDSSGNIYIADGNNHRVVKLNSNMEYMSQFGTGVSKTDNTGLNSPYGVSVDSDGNIYITDQSNHRLIKLTNLSFEILCKIMQYINTPSLLDINISEQVDTFRILLNDEEIALLNNISSYRYNLDRVWNTLNIGQDCNILIKTSRGDRSLSYTKLLPETKMYTNTIKDVLFEYSVNPSYDISGNPLPFIYTISLDSKVLYNETITQTDTVISSINIPYNDLVVNDYKNITDRNIVIQKTNTGSGEVISYNIPIRIDPKRLFSKYFNGVNNYISIRNWDRQLSELTIQVVKKSLIDSDFTVSTDNSLVSLVGSELKIGGVSTFTGNIYEIRIWEKGKEQPYTYDQLYGNEDGLYALYRLNEYNSKNIYDSCKYKLHGDYEGELLNQEIIPTDSNYLTKVNINNELNDIVKQKEDYEYRYNIEGKKVLYKNIINNNEQEILLPLSNLSILQNISIYKYTDYQKIYKIGDSIQTPGNGWKRIDDRNQYIQYNGTWQQWDGNDNIWHNTSSYTVNNSSSIKFKFKSSSLAIIGSRYNDRSTNIQIKIDNQIFDNFSQFINATTPKYKTLEYLKTNLSNEIHICEIINGTNKLILDAIDIDEDGYLLPIT